MSNRKQRDQNRALFRDLHWKLSPNLCSNCGKPSQGGHFVPPSFGEDGFYWCERAMNTSKAAT